MCPPPRGGLAALLSSRLARGRESLTRLPRASALSASRSRLWNERLTGRPDAPEPTYRESRQCRIGEGP